MALVMELLADTPARERRLLGWAAEWSRSRGSRLVTAMTGACRPGSWLRAGFAPVPARLLPKRQVLMGAAIGPAATRAWSVPWRLSLGDWDVF
ncbi:MAG: hypothetical protein R2712_20445 [Vicinamibacterales bacterium]